MSLEYCFGSFLFVFISQYDDIAGLDPRVYFFIGAKET